MKKMGGVLRREESPEPESPAIVLADLPISERRYIVCVSVEPCGLEDETEDCLAPARERAWSSPIFLTPIGAEAPSPERS